MIKFLQKVLSYLKTNCDGAYPKVEPSVRYEEVPGSKKEFLAVSTWPDGREFTTRVHVFPPNFKSPCD